MVSFCIISYSTVIYFKGMKDIIQVMHTEG